MISACRGGAESSDARDPSASQVKPAAATARAEAETLEPDPEGGELPRGVSAPAPAETIARGTAAATSERGAPPESFARGTSAKTTERAAPATTSERVASGEATARVAPAETSARKAQGEAIDRVQPSASSAPAPHTETLNRASRAEAAPPAHSDGLKTVARADEPRVAKPAAPKPAAPNVTRPPTPQTAQPQPPVPQEPIAPVPPPPPPPAPKASVTVPRTDHVHVDVPAGLQHWLDEDDRMKPWLGKAINVADACYAKVREDNSNASGVIALSLTMHENARPSGKVSSVSGPLNSIVMCATTRLLGVKMPLFTGTEGDSYTVRIHFEP